MSEVSSDLSELVRQELALAKAEATQTATRAGKGAGMLVGAALAGVFVLLFLSLSGWWALGNVIGRSWSALVVMLVWAIIAVAVNPRAARDWAGWVIGATLGLIVMVGGPLTGGSFNPARWFGPALVSSHWTDAWLYIVGPLVGAVAAAFIYWYLFVEAGIFRAAAPEAGPRGLRQDVDPPR